MAEVVKSTVVDADEHIVGDVLPENKVKGVKVGKGKKKGFGTRKAYTMDLKDMAGTHHFWADTSAKDLLGLQKGINQIFLEGAGRRASNTGTIDALIGVQGLAQSMQNAVLGAESIKTAQSMANKIMETAGASALGASMVTTPPAQGATGAAQAVAQENLVAAAGQAQWNAVLTNNQAMLNALIASQAQMNALAEANQAMAVQLNESLGTVVETNKALAVFIIEATGKTVTPVTAA